MACQKGIVLLLVGKCATTITSGFHWNMCISCTCSQMRAITCSYWRWAFFLGWVGEE